jgi:hypothetical protein
MTSTETLLPVTAPEYFRSDVPAGTSGEWVIEKFEFPERPYDPTADPRPECFKYRPGTYTSLRRGPEQFMTDLYDEWWTQRDGIAEALARGGDVVITGLGIGMVAEAILRPAHSRVNHVTIVELSPDVIALVAPYLQSRYPGRIDVVEASALTWEPPAGKRFTVAWHDIWPNPHGPEVRGDMELLEQRYGRFCDWVGFWPKTYYAAEKE